MSSNGVLEKGLFHCSSCLQLRERKTKEDADKYKTFCSCGGECNVESDGRYGGWSWYQCAQCKRQHGSRWESFMDTPN
jgi:hypothetical protein